MMPPSRTRRSSPTRGPLARAASRAPSGATPRAAAPRASSPTSSLLGPAAASLNASRPPWPFSSSPVWTKTGESRRHEVTGTTSRRRRGRPEQKAPQTSTPRRDRGKPRRARLLHRVRLLALLPPYRFGDSMGLLLRNLLEQRRYRVQHRSQVLLGRQTPAHGLGERRLRRRVGRGSRRRLCETVARQRLP